MRECPNCGYRFGSGWLLVLWIVGFNALYLVWMLGNYQPRELKLVELGAYLLCWVSTAGVPIRNRPTVPHKRDDEELRSND